MMSQVTAQIDHYKISLTKFVGTELLYVVYKQMT